MFGPLLLLSLSIVAEVDDSQCFERFKIEELPAALEWSHDLRWTDRENIFWLGLGVWRTDSTGQAVPIVAAGNGANELFAPLSIAYSDGRMVVGSATYSYSEIDPAKSQILAVHDFWALADVDLQQGRLALHGAIRNEKLEFAPSGALAFVAELGQPPEKWQPLYFSVDGPGARSFDHCALMGIGHLRFMTDGNLVLVPGVEGGVYIYDAKGKLRKTFSADEIGFENHCDIDAKLAERFGLDEPGRRDWVNQRRVVDDIVPLPDGAAGLILREIKGGKPHWQMKILRKDGSIRSCPLDIPTSDPMARIKADSFGDQVGLLVSRRGYQRYKAWRTNKLTGERVDFPIKLHPDEPALWLTARYRP